MATATKTLGKTSFVKEFLNDNPQGNVRAVNEAWQAAGFDGTISPTVVSETRSLLGLTGNVRSKLKKSKTSAKAKATSKGKKRGRKPRETTAALNGKPVGRPRGRKSARTVALTDLETDIDRLIFKIMGIGDLTEIEESLRRVRRLLYGALTRG
jgi:hypothetical protein